MQAWGTVRALTEPTRRPERRIVHAAIGAPDSGAPLAIAFVCNDYVPRIREKRNLAVSKPGDVPLYLGFVYRLEAEQIGFGICLVPETRLFAQDTVVSAHPVSRANIREMERMAIAQALAPMRSVSPMHKRRGPLWERLDSIPCFRLGESLFNVHTFPFDISQTKAVWISVPCVMKFLMRWEPIRIGRANNKKTHKIRGCGSE